MRADPGPGANGDRIRESHLLQFFNGAHGGSDGQHFSARLRSDHDRNPEGSRFSSAAGAADVYGAIARGEHEFDSALLFRPEPVGSNKIRHFAAQSRTAQFRD